MGAPRLDARRWDFRVAQPQNPPTPARLRDAQSRLGLARTELERVTALKLSTAQHAAVVGAMSIPDRLAYCCAHLGLQPEALPIYFWQRVHQKLSPSETGWQLPLFTLGPKGRALTAPLGSRLRAKPLPNCACSLGIS